MGGDGTFRGGTLLAKESAIDVVGIPGTIDNDVYGTDFTIGFDTAVNCAIEAIDRIRDTARTFERVFFVEVMGHHTGFIALQAATAGGADGLVIPEEPLDIEDICKRLKEGYRLGKKSAIVVVAEAEKPGFSYQIAQEVTKSTGFESRVCVLRHVQRGGSPTAADRVGHRTGCNRSSSVAERHNGEDGGLSRRQHDLYSFERYLEKEKGAERPSQAACSTAMVNCREQKMSLGSNSDYGRWLEHKGENTR